MHLTPSFSDVLNVSLTQIGNEKMSKLSDYVRLNDNLVMCVLLKIIERGR